MTICQREHNQCNLGYMSPLQLNNCTIEGLKKCSIAKTQDTGLKIAIMNLLKYLKENMKKFINKIY